MPRRKVAEVVASTKKSPFHLADGQINPACLPKVRTGYGWCINWTKGTAQQAFATTPTICCLCKQQFPELLICFGGFCHYRFVCTGCSVPTKRRACVRCRHVCKREPSCGFLSEVITRVTCVKCWQVNLHYEDQLEIEDILWFWQNVDREMDEVSYGNQWVH